MDIKSGLITKTALEHLIFLSGKNIIEVCRTLQITPQQFTDWTKKRRPIPQQRLDELTAYFGVEADTLADEKRFARNLSSLSAIELELFVVKNLAKISSTKDEEEELSFRSKQLKDEYEKQLRITRLSVLLERNDPVLMSKIDAFLDETEQNL